MRDSRFLTCWCGFCWMLWAERLVKNKAMGFSREVGNCQWSLGLSRFILFHKIGYVTTGKQEGGKLQMKTVKVCLAKERSAGCHHLLLGHSELDAREGNFTPYSGREVTRCQLIPPWVSYLNFQGGKSKLLRDCSNLARCCKTDPRQSELMLWWELFPVILALVKFIFLKHSLEKKVISPSSNHR